MSKVLETKEVILDKNDLKNYLEKLASDNIIKKRSARNTYPINRMKENIKYISLVYTLLNEHIKIGIPIHSAGEWLLDNYYIIEKISKSIVKNLSVSKYINLPGLENSGFARIYVLANSIVSNTDGKIIENDLIEYLQSYQKQKELTMEEIWNIGIFIQINLIEKIKYICEKIFVSQMQKVKVENIVARLIENKQNKKVIIKPKGRYPFIEYMSYKLKSYGKISNPYLEVFEEQINKMGISVSEIINREHFDIAAKTVSMKNSINSLKTISRIDIIEIFRKVNVVENILNQDPAEVYNKMDYITKNYYRTKILEISRKTKISEIFIARKILELCQKAKVEYTKVDKSIIEGNIEFIHDNRDSDLNTEIKCMKKMHVGYYLIDEGKKELIEKLLNKKVKFITYKEKVFKYIFNINSYSILITLLSCIFIPYIGILLFIPIQNAITQLVQYISSKRTKLRIIPKIDLQEKIPNDCATMCVIPVVIKNEKQVEDLMNKMEVYYLANKSENLYFTLLGDCTSSKKQIETFDNQIINKGKELTEILNKKYGNIFNFIYRKREWSNTERCFMGWERKRGLITEFNEYLKFGKNNFMESTFKKIPKIKYVITIDEDTELTLNSAFQLVGAMKHILNIPEIDKINNVVVKGHALIQPRIGLSINAGRKTTFSRLFAGNGGTDLYTNAISNIYQDGFGEGIYTGKGIYDLEVFYQILKDAIPENKILSHDLIEGSFLRCGLSSDILLMDGYPSNYNAYKIRKHRWIRGDIQVIHFLKSKLNTLSKYKIVDNIIRNLNELFIFIVLIIIILASKEVCKTMIPLILLAMPTIIKLFDNFKNQKSGAIKHKLFVNNFSKWTQTIYKFFIEIAVLPDIAILELNATCKSLYRMLISHNYLLEWTTAREAEENNKNKLVNYFKSMKFQTIFGIILLIVFINKVRVNNNIGYNFFVYALSCLWSSSFILMWALGKQNKLQSKLNYKDKQYLIKIGQKTWKYFKNNMVNYLPPDNFQEDRKQKWAMRTSPTNIGLAMLSVISSYDLGFENLDDTLKFIENMLETIEKLPKWNGHLYNWYNIENLDPIYPLDISSVDSGNFIGYLYTTMQFLKEIDNKKQKRISHLIERIDILIKQTDFSKLYDYEVGLFSIGFNASENKLYDSYYDLLASEARQTSLIAIAKKDIPAKHWNNLGRIMTRLREHKGLISWGGTAFEYLMPNINIETYSSSLIDESCKLLVMSEKEYAKKLDIPWGMSEAAFSLKDFYGNYQYKTFGIPWLGIKRGLADEIVVSPYSSALALLVDSKAAIENLKKLDKEGLVGEYGFYDSIDYKPKKEIVKTYLAHHQGMILTSIDNAINNNIFQKRFMKNPEIQGIKILLEENVPEDIIITKEKKDKPEKIKYKGFESLPAREEGINVISTNQLSNLITDKLKGYTKIKDILINEGVNIYVKNLTSNKIYDFNKIFEKNLEEKGKVKFTPYSSKFFIEDGNIKIVVDTTIAPDSQVEIKKISIQNKGLQDINLEITTYEEPIMSTKQQFLSHPCFDKMFLRYKYDNEKIYITRKNRNGNEEIPYVVTTLFGEDSTLDFEINKENFKSRVNKEIPEGIQKSISFSKKIETALNPIIAMKRNIKVEYGDTKNLYLLTSCSFDEKQADNNLNDYMNMEKLDRVFELSKAQTEAEIRYMGAREKDINNYQKMLKYILVNYSNYKNTENNTDKKNIINETIGLENEKLWKYGISGDYPILLLKLKDLNDYYIAKQVFKAYEYFLYKNINIDLIILTDIDIKNKLIDDKMEKYLNKKGGIFVINNCNREDKRIFEERSNLIIDSHKGNLDIQLEDDDSKNEEKSIIKNNNFIDENMNEYKNEYKSKRKRKFKNESLINKNSNYEKLNYKNGFGTFNEDGSEYWIKQNKENRLDCAWSNIMANENFGCVITEGMGGFTWYENSQNNKLTKFLNDAYDDKSFDYITIEEINFTNKNKEDNNIWSIDVSNIPDENDYYTCYGFGYSSFVHSSNEIKQEYTIFIPKENNAKVCVLRLENLSNNEKVLKIKYNIDWQLGSLIEEPIIKEYYKENLNMLFAKNLKKSYYFSYITSSEKINENKEIEIRLKKKESKNIVIVLGAEKNEMDAIDISAKFTNNYFKEFEITKNYWKELVSKITTNTPLESFNIMQNGWLAYQSIVSRLLARTGYYQSSGGFGFRDQLQDAICMKWIDSNILKKQILLHANHQFYEGDVEHWWHDNSNLGIRARYSDDMLWLVYAVEEYIDFTGDYSILDEQANYIIADELTKNEEDRVDFYNVNNKKGSIFEHCYKAILCACKFGKHDLPLIKSGDWNDGMNRIGNKEKGESVWLGFFLYDILKKFIDLVDHKIKIEKSINISKDMSISINEENKYKYKNGSKNKSESESGLIIPTGIEEINQINLQEIKQQFMIIMKKLKKSLNKTCWDGRWFIRAFDDSGNKIGTSDNNECKIDSICQSWSVISGAADNDKKFTAMASVENYLIDNKNNIIKLLTPALEKENYGYISAYNKGMRENGGQYTHAAIWTLIAETMLKKPKEAMEIYKKINPIEHTKSKEEVLKYKVEPYVVSADIYSEDNLAGRGGWTWYTGSSAWLYEAQIRNILGINIYHGYMTINPCVSDEWNKFEVKLKWKNSFYTIRYSRIGEYSITLNGKKIDITNKYKGIKLSDEGNYIIEITF